MDLVPIMVSILRFFCGASPSGLEELETVARIGFACSYWSKKSVPWKPSEPC